MDEARVAKTLRVLSAMTLTAAQIERTSRSLVHCIADCRECGWRADEYTTAAREASGHVRKTGHVVTVEQAIVYTVRPCA